MLQDYYYTVSLKSNPHAMRSPEVQFTIHHKPTRDEFAHVISITEGLTPTEKENLNCLLHLVPPIWEFGGGNYYSQYLRYAGTEIGHLHVKRSKVWITTVNPPV